ncbi:hypothetical protein U1Q18_037575 [Sarracenia purpurea var. burkii]
MDICWHGRSCPWAGAEVWGCEDAAKETGKVLKAGYCSGAQWGVWFVAESSFYSYAKGSPVGHDLILQSESSCIDVESGSRALWVVQRCSISLKTLKCRSSFGSKFSLHWGYLAPGRIEFLCALWMRGRCGFWSILFAVSSLG